MLDVLYTNGKFYTQNHEHPVAASLAVHQGRIVGVDDTELVPELFTKVIDLAGAAVVPGFNDAHCHLSHIGETTLQVDLRPGAVNSMEQLLEAVENCAESTEPGNWVVGAGYDQNYLGAHPTAEQLDTVSHGRPVYLVHNSRHMGVANTAAFEIAGFPDRKNVPIPEGGDVLKDDSGTAVGLLLETARSVVQDHIPAKTVEDVADLVAAGSQAVLDVGITSITEPGIGAPEHIGMSRFDLAGFQLAKERGQLGVRATVMPYLTTLHSVGDEQKAGHRLYSLDLGLRSGMGDDFLRIGPAKVLSDGSLIGRSAFMCCDYNLDDGNRGFLQFSEETLRERLIGAHLSGWQLAVHAIGDAALDVVLDIFAQAQELEHRPDARHRIEHASVATEAQISRIADLGLIPVPQGRFIHELGDGVLRAVGEERAHIAYRVKAFSDAGIELPASTDAPVVDASPILNIASLVNRTTAAGRLLGPQERITVAQAVRAYTVGSAHAVHEESYKGALRRGFMADFVVLSEDLYEIPVEEIHTVTVTATVVGGQLAAGSF